FFLERVPQVLIEIGKRGGIRQYRLHVSQIEPLADEVCDQRIRVLIGEHALYLLLQYFGIGELALFGYCKPFVIRNAAPKEERQCRSKFTIAARVGRTSRRMRGIGLDAEEEIR